MSRSKFYCRPRFFLALSALVGTAALGVYFFRSVHVYRDVAYCYAYAVREAAVHGNWSYVLDPGLPMLNMALGALVALTGVEARHAVMLVGGAFYILAIFPLYFLLKRFVSPLAASLGCLIFILTPKVMRFHCSGLLESARDFFFIASLLMLFRLSERKNFANLALFALSLTGLALARAESIVIACCFILLLPLRDLWSYRHSFTAGKFCRSLLLCLAAGLLLLAFVSPKLAYNFRKTGYPTVDTRFNPYLNALFKWDRFVSPPPDAVPADTLSSSASALKNGKFAWGENILSLFENLLRGGYELYWGVAIIGILLCVFRLSKRVYEFCGIEPPPLVKQGWRWEYTAFVVLTLAHCALYYANGNAYRYYTFIVPLLIPFMLVALHLAVNLTKKAPRKYLLPAALAVGGILLAVVQFDNGVSPAFTGEQEWKAGCFLKDHADSFRRPERERVRVMTKSHRICFFSGFEYANSSLNSKSKELAAREGDFDLAVFDADEDPSVIENVTEKYDLAEWDKHPFPYMKVFVPRNRRGIDGGR